LSDRVREVHEHSNCIREEINRGSILSKVFVFEMWEKVQ